MVLDTPGTFTCSTLSLARSSILSSHWSRPIIQCRSQVSSASSFSTLVSSAIRTLIDMSDSTPCKQWFLTFSWSCLRCSKGCWRLKIQCLTSSPSSSTTPSSSTCSRALYLAWPPVCWARHLACRWWPMLQTHKYHFKSESMYVQAYAERIASTLAKETSSQHWDKVSYDNLKPSTFHSNTRLLTSSRSFEAYLNHNRSCIEISHFRIQVLPTASWLVSSGWCTVHIALDFPIPLVHDAGSLALREFLERYLAWGEPDEVPPALTFLQCTMCSCVHDVDVGCIVLQYPASRRPDLVWFLAQSMWMRVFTEGFKVRCTYAGLIQCSMLLLVSSLGYPFGRLKPIEVWTFVPIDRHSVLWFRPVQLNNEHSMVTIPSAVTIPSPTSNFQPVLRNLHIERLCLCRLCMNAGNWAHKMMSWVLKLKIVRNTDHLTSEYSSSV